MLSQTFLRRTYHRHVAAVLLLLTAGGVTRAAEHEVRKWKSIDGHFMSAELLEFSDKEIKVKRQSDFTILNVPLDRLSAEDKAFILAKVDKRRMDASLTQGAYAAQIQGKFAKGTSKDGLLFQLYGNPQWDGKQRYPLVIWLHGSGSSGTDNEKQMGGATGAFTKSDNQNERPCFVLAPQCPDANIGWKKDVADHLMALIADLVHELPVDPKRIYLTGSSMGGFGAWSLAAKHPEVFACSVPLCGGGDPKSVEALKGVPVWAFHGDQDEKVPIDRDRAIVAALKAAGGNVQFTELTGQGHNIAGNVYARHELHEWMFSQTKG